MKATNFSITGPSGPLPAGTEIDTKITADGEPDTAKCLYSASVEAHGRGIAIFPECTPAGGGNMRIIAPGCAPWSGRIPIPPSGAIESDLPVVLEAGQNPFD